MCTSVFLAKVLTRFCLHIDEWQQEILFVGGREHFEPLRADHAVEPLLEVQELQVHFEDSVIAKGSIMFDLVSVEDCEHFARGSPPAGVSVTSAELFYGKILHLREAATGCRTCENFGRHRHVSNPRLEQNLAPPVSVSALALGTLGSEPVDVRCGVIQPNTSRKFVRSANYPKNTTEEPTRCREGHVVVVEVAVRRTQTKQVFHFIPFML